jgi:hypothetical protein
VWLARGGERISTIDLVGNGFLLLAGPEGKAWTQAADLLASQAQLALEACMIGPGGLKDTDNAWGTTYGVGADGAVLIRPDGYVAWRSPSMTADPMATLRTALAAILAKP